MSYTRKLVVAFLTLIGLGAVALSLPGMMLGDRLDWVDSLFMATSAVCVTGLTSVDFATRFTPAAQAVVLLLVQLGGVGIAIGASLIILARHRLPIATEDAVTSALGSLGGGGARSVTLSVVRFTLLFEAFGTMALLLLWPDGGGLGTRLWHAVFHAISAFCNAGFALFPQSFEGLTGHLGLNLVIMLLITLGGFGFVNLHELVNRWRLGSFRWSRFSVFLKVTVVATLALSLGGAAALLLFEWHGAFDGLRPAEKVTTALFHSVSARTAGFSAVPMTSFASLSLLLLSALMFVGGSSGSCAGGIKLGSFAVILATLRSYFRNALEPVLFQRRVPYATQRRAFALLAASLAVVFAGVLALELAAEGWSAHARNDNRLIAHLFEVVSAVGTVGLSTGITAGMSDTGKLCLIALMFVGRLGPLALIEAWAAHPPPRSYKNPEESLPVG